MVELEPPLLEGLVEAVAISANDASAGGDYEPPPSPHHGPIEWERFLTFLGPLEGYIVAGRLNSEGVPTLVEVDTLGLICSQSSNVWVPKHLMHRARWILAWPTVSEAELLFLATGELGSTGSDFEETDWRQP